MSRIPKSATLGIGLCLLIGTALQGEFFPVETFTEVLPGAVHGQNEWRDPGGSGVVVSDPENAVNQVLAITNDSAIVSRPLTMDNGTIRMLFLRFRFTGLQNYSFGLSDSTFPSEFDDFEVEIGMSNARNDLRINNGGQYDFVSALSSNRWYYIWVLVDNVEDEFELYLHSRPDEDAVAEDQLQSAGVTVFDFRNRSAQDLKTFYIKTGGGGSQKVGPLYLDDIHVETTSSLNLSNPVSRPPIWMLSPRRLGEDLQFKIVGECSAGCRIIQSSNVVDWIETDLGVVFETPQWVVITNAFTHLDPACHDRPGWQSGLPGGDLPENVFFESFDRLGEVINEGDLFGAQKLIRRGGDMTESCG